MATNNVINSGLQLPASSGINTLLYSSAANIISALPTANNSILGTNGTGVPAYTTALPTAVQVGVNSLNSGTNASATTFWSGAGTWIIPGGTLLNIQTISATGAGLYTPTVGMNKVLIEFVAGGGGTGAVIGTSATKAGASGGAASGGYFLLLATSTNIGASATVNVGAGGIAGTTAGGNGGQGGSSTIIINGSTWTAIGGLGSLTVTAAVGTTSSPGAAGAINTVGANATVIKNIGSQAGNSGLASEGTFIITGDGGSSPLGFGGASVKSAGASQAVGTAGTGFGSGAGGAWSDAAATNVAGAVGNPGYFIFYEYT